MKFTLSAFFGLYLSTPALASLESLGSIPLTLRNLKSASQITSSQVTIRGVDLGKPLSLRIQVTEISSFASDARRGFTIEGQKLVDEKKNSLGDKSLLTCAIYKNPMAILNNSPFDKFPSWLCQAKNFQRILQNSNLKLSSSSDWIRFGKHVYRGSLEIIQRDDRLSVINHVGLEPYLMGLLNEEMNSSFPPEAIKAQVIAARSYALATTADRRKEFSEFDLFASEADQVYNGSLNEDSLVSRLISEVSGKVLFHNNHVLKAYYHSSSGGFSELPKNVWGSRSNPLDEKAFVARASPIDSKVDASEWSAIISPKQGSAWEDLGEIRKIQVLSRSDGKRVKSLMIDGTRSRKIISGTEFRHRLGARFIKSTYFTISKTGNSFLIEGRGWGHGVGLSQLGAKALASEGKSYEEILKYYYPFAGIQDLPQIDQKQPKHSPQKSFLKVHAR